MKKHKKIHDVGGEKLRCPTCKRTFYNKHEMGTHICKHYSCDICGEKFLRARNLGFHKRMHMGEALYSCDQCESMFLKKKRLSDHIRTVHQQKKHQCDICEKFFQSKVCVTLFYKLYIPHKYRLFNICLSKFFDEMR